MCPGGENRAQLPAHQESEPSPSAFSASLLRLPAITSHFHSILSGLSPQLSSGTSFLDSFHICSPPLRSPVSSLAGLIESATEKRCDECGQSLSSVQPGTTREVSHVCQSQRQRHQCNSCQGPLCHHPIYSKGSLKYAR